MSGPIRDAQATAPHHWDWVPLKRAADINQRVLAEDTDPDHTFRYIDITAVRGDGSLGELAELRFGDAPSRARRVVRGGDVVVSTVRTYLRAIARVPRVHEDLVCSTGFAVLSARPEVDPRFLYWWARSTPFIEEVVARSVGVGYPAVSPDELGRMPAPIPPRFEQVAISSFLDRETARIDKLIWAKESMARLLLSRTRTLAGMIASAGSGPAARVRHVTELITSGPRDWSRHFADEGVPFVRITNVAQLSIELDLSDLIRVSVPPDAGGLRTCIQLGDVLLSITAEIGSVGVARDAVAGGHVSQHVALVRPAPRFVEPEWLALNLFAPEAQMQLDAGRYGGTKTQLSLEDVADVSIPVPELGAQRKLVAEWMRTEAASAHRLARMANQIRLLRERRQALIAAAVTGQIEVSEGWRSSHGYSQL